MQAVPPKTTAADITAAALRSFDRTPSPRAKLLMQAAVKHLHAFATDICRQKDAGTPALVSGRVLSTNGTSIRGAVLDIWQVPANGMYENTDPSQVEFNCRGRLRAADDGSYRFWTVKPVPYPIPKDGPAGLILDAAQRHNMRAAHIHVIVEAPGYEKVISEVFVAGDPYIDSDAVFGVKDSLIVDFVLHESAEEAEKYGRPVPFYTANYDFVLVPGETQEEVKFSGALNPCWMARILPLSDAVAERIHDGDQVACEGFTHLIPFAAGHEIIRQGKKNLTLIRMTPDLIYDQMIGMGVAAKLVFSWGGNPGVGSLHRLRDAVERQWPSPLDIEELSHAGMVQAYSAGAAGLPFGILRGFVGTDLPKVNGKIKAITCPFTGELLAAVPAVRPDVAVIHAQKSDRKGNVLIWGNRWRAEGSGARG